MKEKILSWFKKLNFPPLEEIFFAYDSLEKRAKNIFIVLVIVFTISFLALVVKLNNKLMIDIPIAGGSLTEGVIGSPRFINPLLATSDVDRDLTALVYSGLLRLAPGRGYEPDLAESYEVSDDGLIYTFHLRKNLRWSDGQELTANDIIFTINRVQDQVYKSPRRGSWNGVTVSKIDDQTVQFSLKKPYNFFLGNTTLGIIPAHLWEKIKPEQFPLSSLNTSPIGSGPYEIANISKDKAGIPQSYDLKPAKKFALGTPRVSLVLRFYNNEQELISALEKGEVNSASTITPNYAVELVKKGHKIIRAPLPRIFGVFLNSSRNQLFIDPNIRQVLDLTIDRETLIQKILSGYGLPLYNILPKTIIEEPENKNRGVSQAKDFLEKKKEKIDDQASFTLATANISELKAVAEILTKSWGELGIKVNVEVFEPGDLNQEVIRPRRYDALLFGEVVGRDYDLYPFWHSSQRLDPGLNIALYVNKKADTLLEEIRESNKVEDLGAKYQELADEITKDQPAIFLYQPDFLYAIPTDLKGVQLPIIASPADRFSGVHKWYFRTDRVWGIFARIASYF